MASSLAASFVGSLVALILLRFVFALFDLDREIEAAAARVRTEFL